MWGKIINGSVLLAAAGLIGYGAVAFTNHNQNWTPNSGKAPPPTETWIVTKVSDGDTIKVRQTNGEEMKIRFCGIDAPEKSQKLGKESTTYLQSLIDRGDGSVMISAIEKDRYGRTVAEVFVQPKPGTPGYLPGEEIFVNGDMVMAGLAYHYEKYSGNCPNRTVIVQSEEIAKGKQAGVWGDSGAMGKARSPTIAPWEWRKRGREN